MSRWWLVLILTLASATGWAQSAAGTAKAQADTRVLEQRLAALGGQRATLAKKYEDELKAVDRLKKQRASWRRDRELRDSLADANETAGQLAATSAELTQAQSALAAARRTLLAAIDAELAAGATGPRAHGLAAWRAQLAPHAAPRPIHRIVIPDTAIDPLADPEELDQAAAALRDSEAELIRQVKGLEKQAQDLDDVAKLRKAHERADLLAHRDDDSPHRTQTPSTSRTAGAGALDDSGSAAPEAGSPEPPSGGGGTTTVGGPSASSFESDATLVLADVIDPSTIEQLTKAQRSGDPAQRALAAKHARDAVAARLDQLRKKRLQIEAEAKSRRLKK
jgi:hypothetical protein